MKKNSVLTIIMAVLLAVASLSCWLKPETEFSESERRLLAAFPELSLESIFSGEFMSNFESYGADQFPFRDRLRTIKALFSTKVFAKKDNNKLIQSGGHISKLEYPPNPEMLDYAAEKFNYLYNTFMKDTDVNVYLSLIPDKNYYIADKDTYLTLDYPKFISDFAEKVPFAKYIDVSSLLSADDFYKTDSHWKQESIIDLAEHLAKEMGITLKDNYTVNQLDVPFYGVYAGQSALPTEPDVLKYLTSDTLDGCMVKYFDTGAAKEGDMYNMDKAHGKDPYEMFLSGSSPLVTIENPSADTDKELVIFRDSYGSSLAPLFANGYKKITVVDIRYMQSNFIGNFIEFDNQDVLFIYSTTLINNSTALR